MKRMKKFISLLLTATLLLSTVPVAFAEAKPALDITDATIDLTTGVKAANVYIAIANNPGVTAAEMKVVYDTDMLQLGKPALEDMAKTDASLTSKAGSPVFAWTFTGSDEFTGEGYNFTGNGNMFRLPFQAKEGAVSGTYVISITNSDTRPYTIFQNLEKTMDNNSFEYTSGTITIIGGVDVVPTVADITGGTYTYGGQVGTMQANITNLDDLDVEDFTYQWYIKGESDANFAVAATTAAYTPEGLDAGTYTVYCEVTNTYNEKDYSVETNEATVTIVPASIEGAVVDFTAPVYTGSAVSPTVNAVTLGTTTLDADDYDVDVTAQTVVGEQEYTLAITGKDNYTGSVNVPWNVAPAKITVTADSSMQVYNNGQSFDLPTVTATTVDGSPVTITYAASQSDLITFDSETLKVTGNANEAEGGTYITAYVSADNHENTRHTFQVIVSNKEDVTNKLSLNTGNGPANYADLNNTTLGSYVTGVNTDGITVDGTPTVTYKLNGEAANLSTPITAAGTYKVTAIYDDNTQNGVVEYEFTVDRARIAAGDEPKLAYDPAVGLVYNGEEQTGVSCAGGKGYGASPMDNTVAATDAGEYSASFGVDGNHAWSDGSTDNKTIEWSIAKAAISTNDWIWDYSNPFTFAGEKVLKYVQLTGTNIDMVEIDYEHNNAWAPGEYTATIRNVTVKENYTTNYTIDAETVKAMQCEWEILPIYVDVSSVDWQTTTSFVYNGQTQKVEVVIPEAIQDQVTAEYSNNEGINVYNYTATVNLFPAQYCELTGTAPGALNWSITKAPVTVPTAIGGLTYNGNVQTGVNGYNDDVMTIVSGMISSINVAGNTYSAEFELKDKDNYEWTTNDTDNKIVDWNIGKNTTAKVEDQAKSLRFSNSNDQTFTAEQIKSLLGDNNTGTNITITGVVPSGNTSLLAKSVATADAVTYALSEMDAAPDNADVVLTISYTSNNYADGTVKLTVTVMDKNDVSSKIDFDLSDVNLTYNGADQSAAAKKADVTDDALTAEITYEITKNGQTVTEIKDAGTYTVTAIYEDADNYGTQTQAVTVAKKSVFAESATVATKTYDGTTDAVITGVTITGVITGEIIDSDGYTVTNHGFNDADVKDANCVNIDVALVETDDVAKNYAFISGDGAVLASVPVEIAATIQPLSVGVTLGEIAGLTYTGVAQTPAVSVTATGTVGGYQLVENSDYTVSYANNTNAGTGTATVTAKTGSNYTFTPASKDFTIGQASLAVNGATVATKEYDGTDAATVTAVTFTGLVNGEALTLGTDYTVTATFEDANAGDKSVSYTVTLASTAKAQNYTLTTATGTSTGTITKAKPVPTPVEELPEDVKPDTEMNLWDVIEQIFGEIIDKLGGTAAFKDDEGNVMTQTEMEETKVEANKEYEWVYIPAEGSSNVDENSGAITLYQYTPYIPTGGVVTVDPADNGTVTLNTRYANAGATVTVTTVPNAGYELSGLTVVSYYGANIPVVDLGNGKFAFVMPDTAVSVQVTFAFAGARNVFVDVPEGSWYYGPVYYAYNNGLMNGVGDGSNFAPGTNLTRGMLMTILARLDGVNTNGGAIWYTKGMEWAKAAGISDGTMPEANITREQAVTMLYRYAGSPAVSGSYLTGYSDAALVSTWAEDAMNWATSVGLIQGNEGKVNPTGTATRAEIATMLMRFVENVVK